MKISDLKEHINQTVTIRAICDQVNTGITQNDKSYLALKLKDKTGIINARLWNASPGDIANWVAGDCYQVEGAVTEYRNVNQLKIMKYSKLNVNEVDLNEFIPQAPIDSEAVYQTFINLIINFKNENYKKLMTAILNKYESKFKVWPAAISIHHAIKSGLLWHSYTMLQTAQAIGKIYQDREIDHELLYSGVILHDLGKIIEIKSETKSKFSIQGMLIGHISIMQSEIYRLGTELGIDTKALTLLQHMVIASHGKLEFGSPVTPRLMEAEILSHLDMMDARIYMIDQELQNVKLDQETPKAFALEQRSFIRHYRK